MRMLVCKWLVKFRLDIMFVPMFEVKNIWR